MRALAEPAEAPLMPVEDLSLVALSLMQRQFIECLRAQMSMDCLCTRDKATRERSSSALGAVRGVSAESVGAVTSHLLHSSSSHFRCTETPVITGSYSASARLLIAAAANYVVNASLSLADLLKSPRGLPTSRSKIQRSQGTDDVQNSCTKLQGATALYISVCWLLRP